MGVLGLLVLLVKVVLGVYFVLVTFVASAVAANQERKIWAPPNMPSLSVFAMFKVFVFNLIWIALCAGGCFLLLIRHVLSGFTLDVAQECNIWVERKAAMLCMGMIGTVQVVGEEHLPPDDTSKQPAPVYIANHASQIDLGAVYFIQRRYKWIAKQSVLFIPGVGMTMYFGQHVLINRSKGKNKSSVSNLFQQSNTALQSGIPMFLFPQGTRVMAKQLPFKDGAFIMAQTNQSQIVPISIDIPMGVWESLYPLPGSTIPQITITIHKPISVTGKEDRAVLKKQCFDQIYSCLPKIWVAEDKKED